MKRLQFLALILCSLWLACSSRAQSVSVSTNNVAFNVSTFGLQPNQVRSITVTPSRLAVLPPGFFMPSPMTLGVANYPQLTNGYAVFSNQLCGLAMQITFSTYYSTYTTNYLIPNPAVQTNADGSVNAAFYVGAPATGGSFFYAYLSGFRFATNYINFTNSVVITNIFQITNNISGGTNLTLVYTNGGSAIGGTTIFDNTNFDAGGSAFNALVTATNSFDAINSAANVSLALVASNSIILATATNLTTAERSALNATNVLLLAQIASVTSALNATNALLLADLSAGTNAAVVGSQLTLIATNALILTTANSLTAAERSALLATNTILLSGIQAVQTALGLTNTLILADINAALNTATNYAATNGTALFNAGTNFSSTNTASATASTLNFSTNYASANSLAAFLSNSNFTSQLQDRAITNSATGTGAVAISGNGVSSLATGTDAVALNGGTASGDSSFAVAGLASGLESFAAPSGIASQQYAAAMPNSTASGINSFSSPNSTAAGANSFSGPSGSAGDNYDFAGSGSFIGSGAPNSSAFGQGAALSDPNIFFIHGQVLRSDSAVVITNAGTATIIKSNSIVTATITATNVVANGAFVLGSNVISIITTNNFGMASSVAGFSGTYKTIAANTWTNSILPPVNGFAVLFSGGLFRAESNGITWATSPILNTNSWTVLLSGTFSSYAGFSNNMTGGVLGGWIDASNLTAQWQGDIANSATTTSSFSTNYAATNGLSLFTTSTNYANTNSSAILNIYSNAAAGLFPTFTQLNLASNSAVGAAVSQGQVLLTAGTNAALIGAQTTLNLTNGLIQATITAATNNGNLAFTNQLAGTNAALIADNTTTSNGAIASAQITLNLTNATIQGTIVAASNTLSMATAAVQANIASGTNAANGFTLTVSNQTDANWRAATNRLGNSAYQNTNQFDLAGVGVAAANAATNDGNIVFTNQFAALNTVVTNLNTTVTNANTSLSNQVSTVTAFANSSTVALSNIVATIPTTVSGTLTNLEVGTNPVAPMFSGAIGSVGLILFSGSGDLTANGRFRQTSALSWTNFETGWYVTNTSAQWAEYSNAPVPVLQFLTTTGTNYNFATASWIPFNDSLQAPRTAIGSIIDFHSASEGLVITNVGYGDLSSGARATITNVAQSVPANSASFANVATNAAGTGNIVTTNQTRFSGQTWVDKVGNDTNGQAGNLVFPFYTTEKAITNSSALNSTINYGVGNFDGNFMLRSNGMNFYFPAGSTLTSSNHFIVNDPNGDAGEFLFADWTNDPVNGSGLYSGPFPSGVARTNIISGFGNFTASNTNDVSNQGLNFSGCMGTMVNPNSVFRFEGNNLTFSTTNSTDNEGTPFSGFNDNGAGDYSMTWNKVSWESDTVSGDGHGMSPFEYAAGRATYRINEIYASGFANCFYFSDLGTNPEENPDDASIVTVFIGYACATNSNFHITPGGETFGSCFNWYGNGAINQEHHIICPRIDGGSASAIFNKGGQGKHYFDGLGAGKIQGLSTTNPIIHYEYHGGTNNLWLAGYSKITDKGGGGFYGYGLYDISQVGASSNFTNGGNMFLDIDQWEEKSANYVHAIVIRSGTHTITSEGIGMTLPNGQGANISNAVVTFNNFNLNTSASSTPSNQCIFICGSPLTNLVTLNNCTLISAAGVNAIDATNGPMLVVMNGAHINGTISTNIAVTLVGTNWFGNVRIVGSLTVSNITILNNLAAQNGAFSNSLTLNGSPVLTNVVSTNISFASFPTNWTGGKWETNNFGATIQVTANAALTTALISGQAQLALVVPGQTTNYATVISVTTIGSAVGTMTNGITPAFIPAGGSFTFTNTSSGAGDSGIPVSGQVFIY